MWMIQGRKSGMTSVLAQVLSFDRMEKIRLGLQNEKSYRLYSPQLVTFFANC
jgi:hypothetical protein